MLKKVRLCCYRYQFASLDFSTSFGNNELTFFEKESPLLSEKTATSIDYEKAKPFTSIPGPRQLPFIGNLLDYKLGPFSAQTYHKALKNRHKKYGPIVRENFAGRHVVHIFDPEDARVIFQNEGKIPYVVPLQETVQIYRKMKDLSLGLGNLNGQEWYKLKRNVQKAMLRPQSVFEYIPLVEEVASDFIAYLKQSRDSERKIPQFKNDVLKWSLETSGMLVFEKRLGAFKIENSDQIQKMIDANWTMFNISGKLKFSIPFFKVFPTPKWRQLVKAEDYFYSQVDQLINETFDRIKTLQNKGIIVGEDQFNFIGYLLSRHELTQKEVYIICLSLFGDGLNTTAPALIYNMYCLASNPEVQEKLFDEIKRSPIMIKNEKLSSNLLQNLPYLKACIKECFRLYPIGTELSRVVKKNLVLSGYQVPAETPVEINMGPQLRNAKYFAEPDKFLPERWLRGNEESGVANLPSFVLTPFGHGPRMCAGRRFAEQDLYIALIKLISTFKIGHKGEPVDQEMHTLLLPTNTDQFVFMDR